MSNALLFIHIRTPNCKWLEVIVHFGFLSVTKQNNFTTYRVHRWGGVEGWRVGQEAASGDVQAKGEEEEGHGTGHLGQELCGRGEEDSQGKGWLSWKTLAFYFLFKLFMSPEKIHQKLKMGFTPVYCLKQCDVCLVRQDSVRFTSWRNSVSPARVILCIYIYRRHLELNKVKVLQENIQ